jgi:hypothetical protein
MRSLGPLLGFSTCLLLGVGCGGKQEPGEAGDDCYRDADCKPGLICAPVGESRQCSSDLTGLESTVETPPAAMPPAEETPEDPPPSTGGTAGI